MVAFPFPVLFPLLVTTMLRAAGVDVVDGLIENLVNRYIY